MSTTSKTKILTAAVIVLLLANIAMLVFFLNSKGNHRKGGTSGRDAMVKEFLKSEIAFTPAQLQQYDTLSKQHKEKVKIYMDSMQGCKESYLKELGGNAFTDSAITITAEKNASMQKGMEIKMLNHIREIRKLCTPAQQPKFDSLFYKMLSRKKPEPRK
jgi:uncharacterized glyoxalase superfamily metalloenzyme YdcJ